MNAPCGCSNTLTALRSFFEKQEGEFNLTLLSLAAYTSKEGQALLTQQGKTSL